MDYPFASRPKGPGFKSPWGYLSETGIYPVSVVSLHWWPRHDWSLWPGLRRASSRTATRPSCRQCDNPTWLPQLSCPGFTLAAGLPSCFTTDGVSCWGKESCGEPAISLHSHHVSLVQRTTRLLPITRDLGSNPHGGTYVKPGFTLLALSCYRPIF